MRRFRDTVFGCQSLGSRGLRIRGFRGALKYTGSVGNNRFIQCIIRRMTGSMRIRCRRPTSTKNCVRGPGLFSANYF